MIQEYYWQLIGGLQNTLLNVSQVGQKLSDKKDLLWKIYMYKFLSELYTHDKIIPQFFLERTHVYPNDQSFQGLLNGTHVSFTDSRNNRSSFFPCANKTEIKKSYFAERHFVVPSYSLYNFLWENPQRLRRFSGSSFKAIIQIQLKATIFLKFLVNTHCFQLSTKG